MTSSSDDEKIFPSSDMTLRLIKDVYDEEFSRKQNLDDKTNNLMSTASTIATLYGGFGIVTTTKLFSTDLSIGAPLIAMLIGVIALVLSIFALAKSVFIKTYSYAMDYDALFIKERTKKGLIFNDKKIDEYMTYSHTELNKIMFKEYLDCIDTNYKINNRKANNLKLGQIFFFIGVGSIPPFIFLFVL